MEFTLETPESRQSVNAVLIKGSDLPKLEGAESCTATVNVETYIIDLSGSPQPS